MKIRHRKAHFRIWIALAVLLTLGFGAGMVLKQPIPTQSGSLAKGTD
ncbi:MAG: hypothetical protein P8N43_06650 [Alphaproteobacteria bacterium]|nr:hypothetical protein [Alphaproteobacteria bacterium]